MTPALAARTVLPAAAALLFAAWTAAALPFFPTGWPMWLGAAVGLVALVNQRIALAFALAVPVLPLGNYALGLALVYALAAVVWLAVCWREPRVGLLLTVGPLLASIGLIGALPVAGLLVRNPARRALQVAAAVFATAAVTAVSSLDRLGIAASDRPGEAAAALVRSVERVTVVQAVTLALVAVCLPLARGRGAWAAAGLAAFMIAGTLLAAPALPALPIVAVAWLICLGLIAEPRVRARLEAEPEPPTRETVTVVRALRPVQEVAGHG